jgi:hypothetical protein
VRDLAVLFLHVPTTVARFACPSGARAVGAESVLVKQQLLIFNQSRKTPPNHLLLAGRQNQLRRESQRGYARHRTRPIDSFHSHASGGRFRAPAPQKRW